MKIFVCYASAGSGHSRAAQALYYRFVKDYPQVDAKLADILDFTNPVFTNLYSRGYSLLVSHLKFIWAIGYRLTNNRYVCGFFNFFCRLNCRRFEDLLIKEQPGIILSTHFFPAEVAARLKRKGRINSRLITVVTDFGSHTFWTLAGCDDYIVGSGSTRERFAGRGISRDRIKVMGIPIRPGFSASPQNNNRPEEFTALLITGSFGFSVIEKAVDILSPEIRLLVVCGRNRKLYERLKRKNYASVRLFGFVEDMQELMPQADIIITKPGGSTIAEALAMELPMVFIKGIPGQETENARILRAYGCAISAEGLRSLKDTVANLKAHQQVLESMRNNIRKVKKSNAAEDICRYAGNVPNR